MTRQELDDWVFQQGDIVTSQTLFVFGTAHHIPQFAAEIRRLWEELGLRHVIVSGYRGEAEVIACAAYQLGVPAECFAIERAAANTLENVLFSEPLLRRYATNAQLHALVKLHAAPRTLLTLRKALPNWRLALHRVDYFGVERSSWTDHLQFARKVAQEMSKVARYSERGDIARPSFAAAELQLQSDAIAADSANAASAEPQQQVAADGGWVRTEVGDLKLVQATHQLDMVNGSASLQLVVAQRPDAVGVLPYDPWRDEVVLVEQFRAAPFLRTEGATLTEIVAGYPEQHEPLRDAAHRELHEETGITAHGLIPLATYFPAPTLSIEKMTVYCAIVDSSTCLPQVANGIERITTRRLPAHTITGLGAAAFGVEFRDGLTVAAINWLLSVRPLLRHVFAN